MTMMPFRGKCHTCGHNHDADGVTLQNVFDAIAVREKSPVRTVPMTHEQACALHTMLAHYGDDPRMRCLVELLPTNMRRDFGA